MVWFCFKENLFNDATLGSPGKKREGRCEKEETSRHFLSNEFFVYPTPDLFQ